MSSILTFPVGNLLDVFRANDPADTEALHLTCRRFHNIILQHVDTLPTRLLVCLFVFHTSDQVHLFPAPANNEITEGWGADAERIAVSGQEPQEIQEMHEMFARKTAIRMVVVYVPDGSEPDERLTRLIENFPSAKRAVSLVLLMNDESVGLPTDSVLDHFKRLEMITLRTCVGDKHPSFWSGCSP